ncbi:MAG: hypothetical protein CK546_05710 [Pedosphaera sp.]|nr:MAG: hypothetical protein CK546_05710 [Pedosphaera sp.]
MNADLAQLSQALVAVGCPPEKAGEMAAQLDKRARQLSAERNQSYEQALAHLLTLMSQGWAAPQARKN